MSLPEGVSTFESLWDSTKDFLRVTKGGDSLAIVDSRIHRIKQLFNPGEYETLLSAVPLGEVAFVPYVRYSPWIPEDWCCLTIVVLGSLPLPIMFQFAFSCSIEKIKQGGTVEGVVYGMLAMQLTATIKVVGGDPSVLWRGLYKICARF